MKPPHALEQVGDLLVLQVQLAGVSHMLVLAPAALAVVAARRCDSVRRGRAHFQQPGAGKAFLDLRDFHLHLLSRNHKRHEHHKVLPSRHAVAAKRDVFDRDDEPAPNLQTVLGFHR